MPVRRHARQVRHVHWPEDATEFTVGITVNKQRHTQYSNIPKPAPRMLGNPKRIKFAIRNRQIFAERPDDE